MADSDALNRVHLFRNLPDELLQALVGASEPMLFQAGETIFQRGDPAECSTSWRREMSIS
jgi:CRP-like cAMP-binding protein